MFNTGSAPSLADIAAVTKDNDGFGGGNGWWILIILFAIFGGWGRGGYYGDAGTAGTAGAANNYVLASDFATLQRQIDSTYQSLERKADGINSGLCNGFYTEAQLINGLDKSISNGNNAIMAQLNSMAAIEQNCCCQTQNMIQAGLADVKYTMATDTCAIKSAINEATQAIIQNDNANYRQLHDENVAAAMAAKDAQIAELAAKLSRAELNASQEAQSNYIIGQVKQCPVPAYVVPNPYCNCNSGCCNG